MARLSGSSQGKRERADSIQCALPARKGHSTTSSQHDKANRFRALHEGLGAFLIANAWDAGSARILAAAGVRRISLATSLYRAAMTGLVDAAREAKEQGTFSYLDAR